jgi:hypothetical protein
MASSPLQNMKGTRQFSSERAIQNQLRRGIPRCRSASWPRQQGLSDELIPYGFGGHTRDDSAIDE